MKILEIFLDRIKYCFIFCVLSIGNSALASDDTYKLSTDDVISITVFNEPDLNLLKIKITDDGNISVPLLGQVYIIGKSVAEVEKHLVELFGADYLVNPRVTVSIDEFRPFYINGEIEKPGSYSFRNGLTIEMAITIAGGFTERASKQKIFLVRENETERVAVDLNTTVNPGDIITIEESFF